MATTNNSDSDSALKIGWAERDITPEQPVLISGQFYARVSEGVLDPLSVTVWALESGEEQAIFVSCDIVTIPPELLDGIRLRLGGSEAKLATGLNPMKVILNATHTHAGPEIRVPSPTAGHTSAGGTGLELEVMPVEDYLAFLMERIIQAIEEAWRKRAPGGIAYGHGHAVIGHNRRWVDAEGKAIMYKLKPGVSDMFRHIEGYEDHTINLIAVYDGQDQLSGLVVNVPCPAQEQENLFVLSADWWHETRIELRKRFGEQLYILPQCSAAGDQSPHLLLEAAASKRMLKLKGRSMRQEIACRIADAVGGILPYIDKEINRNPVLLHSVKSVDLDVNCLSEEDVRAAGLEAEGWKEVYERELSKLQANPALRSEGRWYKEATDAYRRMQWNLNVGRRFESQRTQNTISVELHVVRLGEIALATNPFEYYLDFGLQIKVRSPAEQTFLIQLAGSGTYIPSPRSVIGGGYGSVPASNPIGPQGGQQLADYTITAIRANWGISE